MYLVGRNGDPDTPIDVKSRDGTIGNSGVTFKKASLGYGIYRFDTTVFVLGFPEFNASNSLFAEIVGQYLLDAHLIIKNMSC